MAKGVYDKVRELLASQFEVDISKIDENTNIAEDLGADSLDFVEMIMMLEEEFGIVVTDESMYTFKNGRRGCRIYRRDTGKKRRLKAKVNKKAAHTYVCAVSILGVNHGRTRLAPYQPLV